LLGSLGGHFWSADSWLGVTIMVAVLLSVALALASRIKVRAAA
jgi:hypothetical protein